MIRRFSRRFQEKIGANIEFQITPELKCSYEDIDVDINERAESAAYKEVDKILNADIVDGLDLVAYAPDSLKDILMTVSMEIDTNTGILYVNCDLSCEATPEIVRKVKNYIEGQMSDGWGEGLEQQEVASIPVFPLYVDGRLISVETSEREALYAVENYEPESSDDDGEELPGMEYERDIAPVTCSYWSSRRDLIDTFVNGAPFRESHRIQHRNYIR